ncbi:DUF4382 domain-containing protein [Hahella sp. CCB-MM4]|uniref:DUF4382 domain-containing protein n=1 Tax=Hahella sp. (strain CCB-MM4) TaxID=1926491 RepID=UPI00114004D1|nr:DUF4382 domain-containing protein [Hahella sp. CCB-MM4]
MKIIHFLLPLAAAFMLTGCGSGEAEKATKNTDGKGRFLLEVTDAPVDYAAEVVIQYTGVELKPASGRSINFDFDEPKSVDLIKITQEGVPERLLFERIPEGEYSWFRFKVNDSSYIKLSSGETHPLTIPSGSESGLIVNETFNVVQDNAAGFIVDFDLRKSVVEASGNYYLRPVLRAAAIKEANLLSVEVAPEIIADQCELDPSEYAGTVYLFSGKDVIPDDVDSSADTAPIMTAPVHYSQSKDPDLKTPYDAYFARFWSIPKTEYTVAYTCYRDDDPEADDPGMVFAGQTLNLEDDLFVPSDLNVIVKLEP